MKKDSLSDRMKSFYEERTRIYLPRRTNTIIRVDGKAFHTLTRGLKRPFDEKFIADMDNTAIYMCKNIMGAKFAFVQSDEVSILITDYDTLTTEAWFDYNLQKMVSVSASMATRAFNDSRMTLSDCRWGEFDSRVFQISDPQEIVNYFIWRQQDTVRNSIASVAQSLYSWKELHGKNSSQQQEMIFQKGINWNDYDPKLKRGRMIVKEDFEVERTTRTRWVSVAPPTFTEDRNFILKYIPQTGE